MAKIRLRFVNSFINKSRKNQRPRYYFRHGRGGKAIPLPGIPGDEQFMSAYHAALASTSNVPVEIGASRTAPGTINAVVVNYYKSDVPTGLEPVTFGLGMRCCGPSQFAPVSVRPYLCGFLRRSVPRRTIDCQPMLGNWVAIWVAVASGR
jgi:hypothetical protein